MAVILVDSCIITDLGTPESHWVAWSSAMMKQLDASNTFIINPIIRRWHIYQNISIW